MNLPFTRYIYGRETNFPEKILQGVYEAGIISRREQIDLLDCNRLSKQIVKPKLHTIRPNKKGAWKPGVMIDFVFWSGRPYWSRPVRFAPRLPVVSTQKIQIMYFENSPMVAIKDESGRMRILKKNEIEALAHNDGFDSVSQFFQWFDKDFFGSLIHWTDLKY